MLNCRREYPLPHKNIGKTKSKDFFPATRKHYPAYSSLPVTTWDKKIKIKRPYRLIEQLATWFLTKATLGWNQEQVTAWVYNETEFDPSHKDYFCFNKKQSMNSTDAQISPNSIVSTARQHSACYPISWFTLAKKIIPCL